MTQPTTGGATRATAPSQPPEPSTGQLISDLTNQISRLVVPLLSGGTLAVADEPLWTIIAYQLLPLMLIAAVVLTFFNRRTGRVYVGGFALALLVAWIVVASQATHYPV